MKTWAFGIVAGGALLALLLAGVLALRSHRRRANQYVYCLYAFVAVYETNPSRALLALLLALRSHRRHTNQCFFLCTSWRWSSGPRGIHFLNAMVIIRVSCASLPVFSIPHGPGTMHLTIKREVQGVEEAGLSQVLRVSLNRSQS